MPVCGLISRVGGWSGCRVLGEISITIGIWAVLGDVLTPTQTSASFSDIRIDGTVAFRSKLWWNSRSVVPGPAKTMALEDAALACIVDVPSRPM